MVVPDGDDGEGDITPLPAGACPGEHEPGRGVRHHEPRRSSFRARRDRTRGAGAGQASTSSSGRAPTSTSRHRGLREPRVALRDGAGDRSARGGGAARCRRPRGRPLTGRRRSPQRWRPDPGDPSSVPHRVLAHLGSRSAAAPERRPGLSPRPPSGTPRTHLWSAPSTAAAPVAATSRRPRAGSAVVCVGVDTAFASAVSCGSRSSDRGRLEVAGLPSGPGGPATPRSGAGGPDCGTPPAGRRGGWGRAARRGRPSTTPVGPTA